MVRQRLCVRRVVDTLATKSTGVQSILSPVCSLRNRWQSLRTRYILLLQVVCLSVCLSVSTSVTLRYRDHIGWNSSKLISRLVILGCSLSADPDITNLLQGEHPEILAGIGVEYGKSGFRRTKSYNISEVWQDGKSYTRFRLVPKSTTLDDLEGSLCTLFQNTCSQSMVLSFIYF